MFDIDAADEPSNQEAKEENYLNDNRDEPGDDDIMIY